MIEGWYYLHINGWLIYKRELGGTAADIRESNFAIAMWPVDPSDREGAWAILVESLAAGANNDCVADLAAAWGCDNRDAQTYAEHLGIRLCLDGTAWCATRSDFVNLQESPAGFGDTALEALAALCKELGYHPVKTWGAGFKALVREEKP